MTPNPDFSIIVPVLNEEKILEKFFSQFTDSIKAKFSFELIITDGGSSDKSIEIAKKYVDKIVVHSGNHNQSIGEARNNGAKLAIADVLVFLNSDTLIADIEVFFNCLINFKESNVLSKYSAIAVKVISFPDEQKLKDIIFYTFLNNYFKFINIIGIGMGRGECQIVRKKIFESVNGYNPLLFAGEDYDLYNRIKNIGKILFSDQIVIFESPRRFRQKGYFRTLSLWFLNSIYIMIFNKSFSKKWEEVR